MTRSTKDIIAGIIGLIAGLGLVFLALLVCGCAPTPAPRPTTHNLQPATQPTLPLVIQWTHDWKSNAAAKYWPDECRRRFGDNFALFICHGGDAGEWTFASDYGEQSAIPAVRGMRAAIPIGVPLVLVSCNPGHYKLPANIKGVYYATTDVWAYPHKCSFAVDSIWLMTSN